MPDTTGILGPILVNLYETAQETLLLVYRRIGALRTVTSFSAWMFSIVRHEYGRL